MLSREILRDAERLLTELGVRRLRLATAESLTGGLIVAALTEHAGASDVIERGFVTYSNDAKIELLGVPAAVIATHGAVSAETARAMARGALARSRADISVAVTGVAGPDGGTTLKPVGLVHLAAATRDGGVLLAERRFGAIGRSAIRQATVLAAFGLVRQAAGIAYDVTDA